MAPAAWAAVLIGMAASLAGCGDVARLPVSAGTGPEPALPAPQRSWIPTVHIAPATPWPDGRTPQTDGDLRVQAFASGLAHPRWLLVLPNGDVLVAESNRLESLEPLVPQALEALKSLKPRTLLRVGA